MVIIKVRSKRTSVFLLRTDDILEPLIKWLNDHECDQKNGLDWHLNTLFIKSSSSNKLNLITILLSSNCRIKIGTFLSHCYDKVAIW